MPSSPDTDIERFLTIISARFPNKVQSPQDRQAALQWHRLVAGRGDGSALAVARRPPYLMTCLIQVLADTLLYEHDWSQPHQAALRYLAQRVISEYIALRNTTLDGGLNDDKKKKSHLWKKYWYAEALIAIIAKIYRSGSLKKQQTRADHFEWGAVFGSWTKIRDVVPFIDPTFSIRTFRYWQSLPPPADQPGDSRGQEIKLGGEDFIDSILRNKWHNCYWAVTAFATLRGNESGEAFLKTCAELSQNSKRWKLIQTENGSWKVNDSRGSGVVEWDDSEGQYSVHWERREAVQHGGKQLWQTIEIEAGEWQIGNLLYISMDDDQRWIQEKWAADHETMGQPAIPESGSDHQGDQEEDNHGANNTASESRFQSGSDHQGDQEEDNHGANNTASESRFQFGEAALQPGETLQDWIDREWMKNVAL